MAKDTYYFSHDYNARNDRKIAALVKDYKSSGYGIFWATCEMMHEEGGELEFDSITIGSLAKDLNELPELINEVLEKCITHYRLFTKQNEADLKQNILLQSARIIRNLKNKKDAKNAKAESGRLGGIKSGESRRNKENNEAKRSTASSNEANEIKGKEIKGNIITPKNEFSPNDFVCYDLEKYLNTDQMAFEKICMATNKKSDEVKHEIHLCHLWLSQKELYPMGKTAALSRIENWIINSKNFRNNFKSNGNLDANGKPQMQM